MNGKGCYESFVHQSKAKHTRGLRSGKLSDAAEGLGCGLGRASTSFLALKARITISCSDDVGLYLSLFLSLSCGCNKLIPVLLPHSSTDL
jgi:hypothetical protein